MKDVGEVQSAITASDESQMAKRKQFFQFRDVIKNERRLMQTLCGISNAELHALTVGAEEEAERRGIETFHAAGWFGAIDKVYEWLENFFEDDRTPGPAISKEKLLESLESRLVILGDRGDGSGQILEEATVAFARTDAVLAARIAARKAIRKGKQK